jgi:predicted nuclease with TOPRIM domain
MGLEQLLAIYASVITLGAGALGFFLKRAYARLENCAHKEDLKDCQKDIKALNDRFATKEEVNEIKQRMDKIEDNLEYIRDNTMRRDDLIRYFAEINRKLDRA